MKILHLNGTGAHSGAGKACERLSAALRQAGHMSRMLVHGQTFPHEFSLEVQTRCDLDGALKTERDIVRTHYGDRNRSDLSNTHFTIHGDGIDVSRHPWVEDADVVHLHWISSFQTPFDVQALARRKPLVWTLHDFAPMTGGCHFPSGCVGFQDGCDGCPQLRLDPVGVTSLTLRDKKTLWSGRPISLVTPSSWLAEQAKLSAVFAANAEAPVVIPLPVDGAVFSPTPQPNARRALGLPEDGPVILCGATDFRERRKGAQVLVRVFERIASSGGLGPNAVLVSVGRSPLELPEGLSRPYRHLGHIDSERRLASVYAAADLFVLPALEDNSPYMMLEALSCGTPVVAFRVGGIGEIVADGINGRLVEAGNDAAMADAITALLADPARLGSMRSACHLGISNLGAYPSIARQHLAVYRNAASLWRPALDDGAAACSDSPDGAAFRSGPALDRIAGDLLTEALLRALEDSERARSDAEAVAHERAHLIDELHAEGALQHREIASLLDVAAERADLIERLHAEGSLQRREVASLLDVAAERAGLIDKLHAEAERWRREADTLRGVAGRAVVDPAEALGTGSGGPRAAAGGRIASRFTARTLDGSGSGLARLVVDIRKASGFQLLRCIRWRAWWSTKIPPLLVVVYVSVLISGLNFPRAAVLASGYVLAMSCVAAYGHVINDVFDGEADARVGRANHAAGRRAGSSVLCVLLIGCAFLTLDALDCSAAVFSLVALNLLWPTVYSVPGIRLKERGVGGLLSDAAGSHITPTVTALVLFGMPSWGMQGIAVSAAALVWATTLGLKGIVYHQIADREDDLRSGTRTFATAVESDRLTPALVVFNVVVEFGANTLMVVACLAACPLAGLALAIYMTLELVKTCLGFEFALSPDPRLRRRSLPFANEMFYTVWLPLAAAVQVGLQGSPWLLVPLLHMAAFPTQASMQRLDILSVLHHVEPRLRAMFQKV